jgi:hypothetical protein
MVGVVVVAGVVVFWHDISKTAANIANKNTATNLILTFIFFQPFKGITGPLLI